MADPSLRGLGKDVMALMRKSLMPLVQQLGLLADGQFPSSSRWCHTASWERHSTLSTGNPFSRTLGSLSGGVSSGRHVPAGTLSHRKMVAEKLWREFFLDPSQWWDNRSEKVNPKYPDFKHRETQRSLWLDNSWTPPWVEAELAAMAPGTLQTDIFSWNVKLRRYVKVGEHEKTMELFQQMQQEGMIPDKFSFLLVLNACSGLQSVERGRLVHKQIIQGGCESDVRVATSLVDMYAKCGSIEDAFSVFDKMHEHDVISWSAMIGGYAKSGQGLKAMELFRKMQQEGVEPKAVTFVGVLKACANVVALEEGRRVHQQIIQGGCESDVYVANCLVDMYAKCGSIEDAWNVFSKMREHDLVSWNCMIGSYVKSGQGAKAMELFKQMQQEGVQPDTFTFVGMLNACASIIALEEARLVHEQIIRRGLESDVYVANALVDMYGKCGRIRDAWSVFNKMPKQTVVSWNAMLGGYVKSGQGLKALELFPKMQQEGVEPDAVTFVGLLNACASVAALEEGRTVHEHIIRRGLENDVCVATCLVDMYAKCGSIENAWIVFDKMLEHDVVSWCAMIRGYALHGHAHKAVELFKQMGKECIQIDGIIFTCILSACSHGGLLKEGLRYSKSMTSCFNILPTAEHYACMVDLLGRIGRLAEAEEIAKKMPKASLWMSLLSACRIHGDTKMAERAAKRCWELDPENASGHVLLSNIYAATGKWDRSAEKRLEGKVWEEPGRTWMVVNNVVHSFAGNEEHPQIREIREELERLSVQLDRAGDVLDARFVSHEERISLVSSQ